MQGLKGILAEVYNPKSAPKLGGAIFSPVA